MMKVQFKYTRAGDVHQGAIDVAVGPVAHHEIVRAVVQHVADEAGERIAFSMINPSGTVAVGTNVVEPEGVEPTQSSTIESIEIALPGGAGASRYRSLNPWKTDNDLLLWWHESELLQVRGYRSCKAWPVTKTTKGEPPLRGACFTRLSSVRPEV